MGQNPNREMVSTKFDLRRLKIERCNWELRDKWRELGPCSLCERNFYKIVRIGRMGYFLSRDYDITPCTLMYSRKFILSFHESVRIYLRFKISK